MPYDTQEEPNLGVHNITRRWIEVTTVIGCRVACAYCPQKSLTSSYRHRSKVVVMQFDDFKKYISTIPRDVDIAFSGYSEPFLNPFCVDMMEYAASKGHQLVASSTLEGMTVEDAKRLLNIPFKPFHVHLANNRGQEKITLDDRYFDILGILRQSPDFHFYSDGYEAHPKVLAYLGQAELRDVHDRAGNVDASNLEVENDMPLKAAGPIRCDRLQGNVLLPNGDVALCCMDFGLRHVIGNLSDHSYDQLYTGNAFKSVLESMETGESDILCRTCHKAKPV